MSGYLRIRTLNEREGRMDSGQKGHRCTTLRAVIPVIPTTRSVVHQTPPTDKLQEFVILSAWTCQKPAICVRLRSLVGAAIF